MQLHLAIVLLLPAVSMATHTIDRPANLGRPNDEHPGNLTIDQIIRNTMDPNAPESMTGPDGMVLTEFDMWLTKDQYRKMYSHSGDRSKRRAARDLKLRWTNKTLPYMYYPSHFSLYQQYWLRRAMTDWERYTCINFRPATKDDINWARFQNGQGCNSQLGMVGGMQPINLESPGCRWKGLYLHETGHAIGLIHEQQSPLRDDWIWIEMENVKPEWREWFKKRTTEEVNTYGVGYEYSSIMHYGITAFSKDGKSQTIHAKYPEREKEIGIVYLKELAWSDTAIVNKMYSCAAHCPDQDKCGDDGVLNENCQCICKDGSHDTCDRTLTADTSCKNDDLSWRCYIWANQGECDKNPKYMHKWCKKACQLCGTPKPSPPSPCKNVFLDKKCDMWKLRGDCVTNRWWMQQNCAVSCNLCTERERKAQDNCENHYTDLAKCTDWAKTGECAINPDGMYNNCQMSCMACNNTGGHVGFGKTEIAPIVTMSEEDKYKCDNKHDKCDEWAGSDECDANPKYMMYNCRKACGKCIDGTCKNIYSDEWCDWWQGKGECQANPIYMGESCALSCGVGKCEGRATKPPPEVKCENNHDSCADWASSGECDRNPKYMIPNCKKACGKCPDETCKNLYSDKWCVEWAQKGECETNVGPMSQQCAKSCSTGNCKGIPTVPPASTTTTTKEPEVCHNKHDNDHECDAWARAGHCESNHGFMDEMCAQSCSTGICKGIPTVPPTKEPEVCRNKYDDSKCEAWAQGGQCENNPGFMSEHCARSCSTGLCKGIPTVPPTTKEPEVCRNKHGNDHDCDVWAQAGHCDTNPGFMKVMCRMSCGVCTSDADVKHHTPRPSGECVDENSQCPTWAKEGHCDSDRAVTVLKQCRKSCNNCGCENASRTCPIWANSGGCEKNPRYMMRHCQRACGVC